MKPLQFTVCLQCIKQNFDLRLENIAAYFNTHIYRPVSVLVGPCHHCMARPQVADRGTASDKEGSCE